MTGRQIGSEGGSPPMVVTMGGLDGHIATIVTSDSDCGPWEEIARAPKPGPYEFDLSGTPMKRFLQGAWVRGGEL